MANKYSFGDSGARRRIPLIGFLFEILVNVIGIYIAFQVEEWRERRTKRGLEKKYLSELLEEVNLNWNELEKDQDFRRKQEDYLIKLMDVRNRQVDADTINTAIQLLTTYRFYTPTTSVYEDLISSGNLGIIKSDAIRYMILKDNQNTARAPISEQSERAYVENQLTEYFIRRQVYSLLALEENLE